MNGIAARANLVELQAAQTRLAAESAALKRLAEASSRLWRIRDLSDGLNEMLRACMELLGADKGHIHLVDTNGLLRIVVQQGFDAPFLEVFGEVSIESGSACGRALRSGECIIIEDMEADDEFAPYRDVARGAGLRAMQSIPLPTGRDGTPLGVMSTYFETVHRPNTHELQLFGLYARQAADFIQRCRSDEALRASNATLAAETNALTRLHEAGSRLWSAKSMREGLDEMLAATTEMLGADMGNIELLDGRRNQDFPENFCEVSAENGSACGRALRTGKPVVIEDIEADAAFAPFLSVARAAGYRAVVSVPLVSRRGTPLGVMSAHFRSPHRPSDTDLEPMVLYAHEAAAFIERFRSDDALRQSEERLRLAVESSRMAMWDWDVKTGAITWNDEHYRMLGYPIGGVEPSYDAWATRVHPDDRDAAEAILLRSMRERSDYFNEFRILRPDGSISWGRVHGRFLYDGERAVRMIGLMEDVTEARRQAETQRTLVAELLHRTRNLITVVQSIAKQTMKTAESIEDFESRFNHRLAALSRVQSLLSRTDIEPITIGALIRMELEALSPDVSGGRITLVGPEVRVQEMAVQMLSLAIHELTTNAIKYGAFATKRGRLSVAWRVQAGPILVVEWVERGIKPPSADPARCGYGRTLIDRALPYSLSAQTTFELGADALRCVISIPLATTGVTEVVSCRS